MQFAQTAIDPSQFVRIGGVWLPRANLKHLRGYASASAGKVYSTPREVNATSGYVVPASKQFRVWAMVQLSPSGAADVYGGMGYADTDNGFDTNTGPTNAVWPFGATTPAGSTKTAKFFQGAFPNGNLSAGDPGAISGYIGFIVPTGKYLVLTHGTDCPIGIFGYEEAA